jgi:hypothetical protein
MKKHLNKEHLASVKKSYFNILALFLHEDKMESRYLRCLLKWGFELQLTASDMKSSNIDLANITFTQPDEKINKLEAIYHLVYMIYLDEVVDDIELEVAAIFAQTLGFKPGVVSDLFKAIATATQDYDETYPRNVRAEVLDFLAVNEV